MNNFFVTKKKLLINPLKYQSYFATIIVRQQYKLEIMHDLTYDMFQFYQHNVAIMKLVCN